MTGPNEPNDPATLTPEQFRSAEELFNQLLGMDTAARAQQLASAQVNDPAVADEVRQMLKREELAPTRDALDELAAKAAEVREGLGASPGTPDQIGRYRVVRLLGEGGMGQVFEAVQEEPVRRTVALKLIKSGLSNAAAVARFEAEQQALAVMDHPNIARVLDADIHEDGRPYFVMELVPGISITAYCERFQLTLKERLLLFLGVLEAVQHAHQKGVIHRDLKPSNILVAAPEAETPAVQSSSSNPADVGQQPGNSTNSARSETPDRGAKQRRLGMVKIIDFGVAKAVEEPLLAESQATRMGDLVGTPEYMSPEQASLGALDVDIRSDVYSLGLVLYEMLTGGLPISRRELRAAGFDEMRRLIIEQEAAKPSVKVVTSGGAAAGSIEVEEKHAATTHCGLEPAALARRLRGDLDWVLLKALGKDRDHRYQSALDFAADLLRHLEDQPVTAGPPTLRYRTSKFVRRNRGAVVAAALLAFALTAGLVGTSYGLIAARESAREADSQRQTAERTVRFMGDLFNAADPRERAGREITVNEVLDRGANSIDDLEEEHATQLRLLGLFGDIYRSQGRYEEAEGILRRVVAFDPPEGSIEPDQLYRQRLLAAARLGGLLRDRSEFEEAEGLLRSELERAEQQLSSTDNAVGAVYNNLGTVLRQLGRYDEARIAYEKALAAAEVNEQPPHAAVASVLNNLAAVAMYSADWERAAELQQRSITLFEGFLPENHPNFMVLNQNLAAQLRYRGLLPEALVAAEKAVAVGRLALGDEHPSLADALQNLGWIKVSLGTLTQGEASLTESLNILEASIGLDTAQANRTRGPLARCLWLQGRLAEAERHYRDALDNASSMSTADQGGALNYQRDLITLLRVQGRPSEATPLSEDFFTKVSQMDSSDPIRGRLLALAWLQKAFLEHASGRTDEAQQSFLSALETANCSPDAACDLDSPESEITRAGFYAVSGDVENALSALEHYFERDERRLAAMDLVDLEPLFGLPRFTAIQQRWRTAVLGE